MSGAMQGCKGSEEMHCRRMRGTRITYEMCCRRVHSKITECRNSVATLFSYRISFLFFDLFDRRLHIFQPRVCHIDDHEIGGRSDGSLACCAHPPLRTQQMRPWSNLQARQASISFFCTNSVVFPLITIILSFSISAFYLFSDIIPSVYSLFPK